MRYKQVLILFLTAFATSCSSNKYFANENYIVLDKEGLSFTVYSSLEYKQKPQEIKLKVNLDEAKSLTREELGQYHIIEPCFDKKDSIIRDVEMKVNQMLNQETYFTGFTIDSLCIDDWIQKTIIKKFGDKYRMNKAKP